MGKLSSYKTLTQQQEKHYQNKTFRFWSDYQQKASINKDLPTRLDDFKSPKINDLKNEVEAQRRSTVYNDLSGLTDYHPYNQGDLETTFPKDGMFNILGMMFNQKLNRDEHYEIISYCYGFLAMIKARHPIDIKTASNFIRNQYGISPDDAIKYITEHGFIRDNYNRKYFIDLINNHF